MKNFRTLTILALVALTATSAMAVDLATTAAVEVVDGIVIAQTTGMDFGQVADKDGDLVLATDPGTALNDADLISFDDAGYTPAIFSVTGIVGATMTASFTDDGGAAGLTLSAFTVSLDGGTSDEGNLAAITQLAGTDTWNVGATLTVDSAQAAVGVAAPAYTISVVLN